MNRKRWGWISLGAVIVGFVSHLLLSYCPNRDDRAAEAIEEAGGEVRRTPRLFWLSVFADAPDHFYPRGDVWNVELRNAEIGSRVADSLSTLRSLDALTLTRCRLAPEITTNLVPPSESLRMLYALDTNLGDDHIARLGDCPNLVYLMLDGANVTDASIPTISRCRKLGYILIRRCKITSGGMESIRAAFPRANIEGDDRESGGRHNEPPR